MTDRLPTLPLFVDDYEAATAHLTIEEDGAYMRLLRLCWRTPGCSIPDDDAWIKRRMRCDQSTYDCVVRPILEEFFTRRAGRWHQKKLSRVYDYARASHDKRKSAGSKGGRAKPLKTHETTPSNAQAMLKHPNQTKPNQKEEGDAREKAAREMSFLDAAIAALGPAASPISTGFNMVALNQWREAGCSEAHILEWLKARGERMKPNSVGSFTYFRDGPVEALRQTKGTGPPQPKTFQQQLAEYERRKAAQGTGT